MRKKDTKRNTKPESRVVTVGVLVSRPIANVLKELATADERSVSSMTYRLLMESPTLKQKLEEARV